MAYYSERFGCFSTEYLAELRAQVSQCRLLAPNNLTADFVGARGFSVVFRRTGLLRVRARFEWLGPYLDTVLEPDANAFYLNPLVLKAQSRVDPHVDRSLRSYCRTVETPRSVSVAYVSLPEPMQGGVLVLRHGKREVARIAPQVNKLVTFQGDLTHLVTPLGREARGERLSIVCEQYDLPQAALDQIPELAMESGGKRY